MAAVHVHDRKPFPATASSRTRQDKLAAGQIGNQVDNQTGGSPKGLPYTIGAREADTALSQRGRLYDPVNPTDCFKASLV